MTNTKFLSVHFEISVSINDLFVDEVSEKLIALYQQKGNQGLYQLAVDLTTEFIERFPGEFNSEDYEQFINEKLLT